jgi:hypothetical protein
MTIAQAPRTYERFVGLDISATTVEVSTRRPGGKARRSFPIDQTPEGYSHLVRKLQACGDTPSCVLVVMEAPGSSGMS